MSKKPQIKRYLKNVDVQFISLVNDAANRREFVYRAIEGFSPDFNAQIQIHKVVEEEQLVYGIVYAPEEADTYGDAMAIDELKKAAHHFLTKARTSNVDTQHDNMPDDGVVVESYILGKSDSKFPGEKEGAWAVVIKVTDPDTWEAVKNGELKGISLAGKANTEVVEDEDSLEKTIELIMTKFSDTLKKIFKNNPSTADEAIEKDFNARISAKEMRQSVWALEEEFTSVLNDSEITDKKAAITNAVSQFSAYISKLEFGGTPTKKESEMTTEETKKADEAAAKALAEKEEAKKAAENTEPTLEETMKEFMKTTGASITALTEKVASLEKAAPARQSGDDAGEEEVQKSNPKAPLGILS